MCCVDECVFSLVLIAMGSNLVVGSVFSSVFAKLFSLVPSCF